MMAPWRILNFKGKLMVIACIINVVVAVILAREGSLAAILSIITAAWCGMWTYHTHYQHEDAKDINDGRQQ
jgi:hypothetical protein